MVSGLGLSLKRWYSQRTFSMIGPSKDIGVTLGEQRSLVAEQYIFEDRLPWEGSCNSCKSRSSRDFLALSAVILFVPAVRQKDSEKNFSVNALCLLLAKR
jgi:hypothetical protein